MKVAKLKVILKNEWFLFAITSSFFVFFTWLYYEEPNGPVVPQVDTYTLFISTVMFMVGSLSVAYFLISFFNLDSKRKPSKQEAIAEQDEDSNKSTETPELEH